MRAKNIFKKYYALLMLLVFSATVFWGISVTVVKSPALASMLLHPDSLKIVQISDVHYTTSSPNKSSRMLANSKNLLEDAVFQVNRMNDVDVVVFSGDSINSPVKQDLISFAKIANRLKYPWYYALGNHEVSASAELTKEKYFRIVEALNLNYSSLTVHDVALRPYYVIAPKKDYKVIFLDGVIDSRITANGEFTEKQLQWLDEKLTAYKNQKVIIVQHFPVIEPCKSLGHRALDAKEYLAVIDKHNNVVAVLSGHYHCSKITQRNNVLHISAPSLVQYPNSFNVITIFDEPQKIKVEVKMLSTRLENIKEQSRKQMGKNAKVYSKNAKAQASVFYLSKP
ncbi:MAG: metallophosphoesterase [bacterium]